MTRHIHTRYIHQVYAITLLAHRLGQYLGSFWRHIHSNSNTRLRMREKIIPTPIISVCIYIRVLFTCVHVYMYVSLMLFWETHVYINWVSTMPSIHSLSRSCRGQCDSINVMARQINPPCQVCLTTQCCCNQY